MPVVDPRLKDRGRRQTIDLRTPRNFIYHKYVFIPLFIFQIYFWRNALMATMITNDCINCGACEPECPNNAISQGDPVYVIDPKLCTECVGFHDYEACAAVCPVDVCVTDPNNIESEEVLMARARAIHPEVSFPENFESRFRKGEGKAAALPQRAQSQQRRRLSAVLRQALPPSMLQRAPLPRPTSIIFNSRKSTHGAFLCVVSNATPCRSRT